jgi:hypothetical protein
MRIRRRMNILDSVSVSDLSYRFQSGSILWSSYYIHLNHGLFSNFPFLKNNRYSIIKIIWFDFPNYEISNTHGGSLSKNHIKKLDL